MYGLIAVLTTLSNIWVSHTLTEVKANEEIQEQSRHRQRWLQLLSLFRRIS